jgi:hypothetical protein
MMTEYELKIIRNRVESDRIEAIRAIATHHSRVAQVACDLKLAMADRHYDAQSYRELIDYAERLSQEIEKSFLECFGRPIVPRAGDV